MAIDHGGVLTPKVLRNNRSSATGNATRMLIFKRMTIITKLDLEISH